MLNKIIGFFAPRIINTPQPPLSAYLRKLSASGLNSLFDSKALEETRKSTRVYTNQHYLNRASPEINRMLTNTAAVSVDGDRAGVFQNDEPFPSIHFFAHLKPGDPRGLAPEERLLASKKIISSNSLVLAYGGYPHTNPKISYEKPLSVGIFSQAGPQFEMPYLHYSLFGLDHHHHRITDNPSFAHLFSNLPSNYTEAKENLATIDFSQDLSRIRLGFEFISRSPKGEFYTSYFRNNAIIFLDNAYKKYVYEDVALLLASVNEEARKAGKPALLKATSIGMGFFAQIDCRYDIKHHLYSYYLLAYRDLLKSGQYPNIARVEFPIFIPLFEDFFNNILEEPAYSGVDVVKSGRDVLQFNKEEEERYYLCAVNPSDSNALPGNEWGYASVESSIGGNSSLRFDQVYLMNPELLNPKNHIEIFIDPSTFLTKVRVDDGLESNSLYSPN